MPAQERSAGWFLPRPFAVKCTLSRRSVGLHYGLKAAEGARLWNSTVTDHNRVDYNAGTA